MINILITKTIKTMDNVLQKIKNGRQFTLRLNPDTPDRLRRQSSGRFNIDNEWMSELKYIIDNERTTDQFLMFTSEGGKKNWWINVETKEVCYDASGSLQNYIEKDSIYDFDFTFYPAINDSISSQ
jgi:hypothetical protein